MINSPDHLRTPQRGSIDEIVGSARQAQKDSLDGRLNAANLLAESIVVKCAGQATLSSFVFAMHGIKLDESPGTFPMPGQIAFARHHSLVTKYQNLKDRFHGREGDPIAFMGDANNSSGKPTSGRAPVWIGRIVSGPECKINMLYTKEGNRSGYQGMVSLSVSNIHLSTSSPELTTPGMLSVIDEPQTFDIAVAQSNPETFPGHVRTSDAEYVLGWPEIIGRSPIAAGDVAACILMQHFTDVMSSFAA